MESSPENRGLRCFFPTLGILIGFALGWVLHFIIPTPPSAATYIDAATRFFMLLFGLFGWAAGTILDGRKLHCGGTKGLDDAAKRRYQLGALVILALLVLAVAFLATARLSFYFATTLLLLCLLSGEIAWGAPLRVFSVPLHRGAKHDRDNV